MCIAAEFVISGGGNLKFAKVLGLAFLPALLAHPDALI